MTGTFTPPASLLRFIRSLPVPAPVPPAVRLPNDATTWPDESTTSGSHTGPQPFPPPLAWVSARDAYIGHVMTCPHCVTSGPKVPRHCPEGLALRQRYDATAFTGGTGEARPASASAPQ